MKILYVATVRSHIGQFHMPVIRELKSMGYEVHAAFRDNSKEKQGLDLSIIDKTYEIPFERSPYNLRNIIAFKKLKSIINSGDYDIIHCHTPMGGVITRLAAKKARQHGTKVIYTVHGFHFYKGASKWNWIFYYPIEKRLSRYTDVLITINQEDYDLAVRGNFKSGKIVKVNGVGVDLSKFSVSKNEQKLFYRKEYGFKSNEFIMLYAADLSERKNQQMIFKSIAIIKKEISNFIVLMPGQPILKDEYEKLCAKLEISDKVRFLGYRRDIDKLLILCDCVISSSRQEGLPINLIEAAASGKFIIATDIRGNADVVHASGYGVLVKLNDEFSMADEILKAYQKGTPTKKHVDGISDYDEKTIIKSIINIYQTECFCS